MKIVMFQTSIKSATLNFSATKRDAVKMLLAVDVATFNFIFLDFSKNCGRVIEL
jgi:hypothetical protein